MPMRISTTLLTYNHYTNTFSGKLQDIGLDLDGFILVSHRTGIHVEYGLIKEHKTVDGRLLFMVYRPIIRDMHKALILQSNYVYLFKS